MAESLSTDVERWPCGCAKGVTPHGAGWLDCIFTPEQRAQMEARAEAPDVRTPVKCPKGDDCALNKGAIHCYACRRNWPPDEAWWEPDV